MKKINPVLNRFFEKSPITVIARGMIERFLNPERLDKWFAEISTLQYTRTLLFSTIFDIMCHVVLGSRKSVNAAFMASQDEINVSITSIYYELNYQLDRCLIRNHRIRHAILDHYFDVLLSR